MSRPATTSTANTGGPGLLRVRLSGPDPDALDAATEAITGALADVGMPVVETSGDYPNRRGPGVRRYLTATTT